MKLGFFKRRRYRLSTLLIGVTAIAVLMAYESNRNRNQLQSVAAIEGADGLIFFEPRFRSAQQPWVTPKGADMLKRDNPGFKLASVAPKSCVSFTPRRKRSCW